jgi:hypothetical protein
MPTLDWLNRAHAFTTAAQVPDRGKVKFFIDSKLSPNDAGNSLIFPLIPMWRAIRTELNSLHVRMGNGKARSA